MTVLAGQLSPLGRANKVQPWTPAQVTTDFWVDASKLTGTDGDLLSSVPDLSGSGQSFTSSGSNRPTLRLAAQNGLAAIENVQGKGISVARSGWTLPLGYAFYVVAKRTSAIAYSWLFQFPSNDLSCLYTPDGPTGSNWNIYNPGDGVSVTVGTGWNLYCFQHTGTTKTARRNGGEQSATGEAGTARTDGTRTGFNIGSRTIGTAGSGFTGQIGEVIIVNRAPDDTERNRTEGYLAHKWGIASLLPSDHAYKNGAP